MQLRIGRLRQIILSMMLCVVCAGVIWGQTRGRVRVDEERFGPAVRSYLAYLHNEQEVVDDRASRREVNRIYYRHNSNRIRALRQMAIRLAQASDNDYLPELEAVSLEEFNQLFDEPLPTPETLRLDETLDARLRFLGVLLEGREKFYLFARLNPYEQSDLRRKEKEKMQAAPNAPSAQAPSAPETLTRPRRITPP